MPSKRLNFQLAKSAFFAVALLLSASLMGAENMVTISETDSNFTLDNGIVTAEVAKRSGDLVSLKYRELEMLEVGRDHQSGYWSHNAARGEVTTQTTIDPKMNGGERAEISIKGIGNGRPMGNGPGGSVIADIEIRYALGRGDSGVYTYSILSHPTNYPGTSLGEARFCLKLNDNVFDWMTVDSNRNMEMITAFDWNHGTEMNFKEARRMNTGTYKGQVEHKYDYSANQFEVRTWGWQSSEKHVSLWFINPSAEYLSGGPTKFELSAHRDATFTDSLTAAAPPTLLNYWRGSHYGGSICNLAAGENWTKVIGPFFIFCNYGPTREANWQNALAREKIETAAWPYDWVAGVDYPHKNERAVVSGQITVNDPQAPGLIISNLMVGLSAPDFTLPTNRPGRMGFGRRGPQKVEWQNDAKHYEFWVHGDEKGNFSMPNVRPGNYTLHAIADGVLGEFALTNVTVTDGKALNLGALTWQQQRFGKQLWDIGIPNRNGSEFFKGDDYFHWGWYLEYPKLFPNDVNYVVGKSDFRKDWFFEMVPHNEDPTNTTGNGRGRATTWTISFDRSSAVQGRATLRMAICGIGTRSIVVTLNDKAIGTVSDLVYNATINRDGIGGAWCERDVAFDAGLMNAGKNDLKLTIPASGLTSGIIFDYLRLELDDTAQASK